MFIKNYNWTMFYAILKSKIFVKCDKNGIELSSKFYIDS